MKFSDLLDGVEASAIEGDADIAGLHHDSRRIQRGYCFVAMRGESTDGNRFIENAVSSGAVAVVSDSRSVTVRDDIAFARTTHGRRALARMSSNFFNAPAEKLAIVGVTGTNGKTTTTFLVESILRAAGKKSALLGTIEYRIADNIIPAPHTTPEPLELNRFFADVWKAGAIEVTMEVSSHALAQERIYGIPFDVAIFTNLTRDHLDYHRNMEDYFAAKQKLFSGVGTGAPRVAIINQDDAYGRRLIDHARRAGSQVITYGIDVGDLRARQIELTSRGTRFILHTPAGAIDIFSPLVGRVNVYNILAAAGAAQVRGCGLHDIAAGVRALDHVPGRFQRVDCGQPFTVVVDYAHTDDALRNLTDVARDFVQHSGGKGRVITIFGCGGDRDRKKRPLMGEAAGKGSNFVILTSDNPRSEDPLAIIHDALQGLRQVTDFTIEPDRERAIRLAIRFARPGDIVLIAGKGHEKVQILADGVIPFDDIDVARRALHSVGYSEDFVPAIRPAEVAGGSR